jgi:hypothetical protein
MEFFTLAGLGSCDDQLRLVRCADDDGYWTEFAINRNVDEQLLV